MDLDNLADKVCYHTSITQATRKIDVLLQTMGYAKPAPRHQPLEHRSLRQIDMLNYYTDIQVGSLAERIVANYSRNQPPN